MQVATKRNYKPFDKNHFESVLLSISAFGEFPKQHYITDWIKDENKEWVKVEQIIKEYCYFIPINKADCIKIYSSIEKETNASRNVGTDAIRVVIARIKDFKPIRSALTRINRTGNWEKNLKLRVSQALTSYGFDMKCPLCGNYLLLKRNRNKNSRFFGCSTYGKCKYSKTFASDWG